MREFSRRSALATAVATTTAVAITGVLILSESADAQQTVTTPSGLKYIDVKAGTGAELLSDPAVKNAYLGVA